MKSLKLYIKLFLCVVLVMVASACNDDAPEQRDRLPVKFSGTVKNDNSGDEARVICSLCL